MGTLFLIYWSKRAKMFLSHWVELNEEWVIISAEKDKQLEKHQRFNGSCGGDGDDRQSKLDGKCSNDSSSVVINT